MTQSERFEGKKRGLHVILLALNGDVKSATLAVKRRYPEAKISNIQRAEIVGNGLVRRLQALRAGRPDIFAIFMESLDWQRGQNILRVFGLLAGVKRVAIIDARGQFREATRHEILWTAPKHLAHETAQSVFAVIKSQWKLRGLEEEVKKITTSAYCTQESGSSPEILFLRATPGAGTQAGGAATHINGFVNAAVEEGARVRMIANDQIAGLDQKRVALKIIPLGPVGLTRSAFDLHNNLVFTKGVIREVEQKPPDLIYQRYSRFTWAGVEASRHSRRPLFLEYNGSEVWVGKHWDDAEGLFDLLERFESLNLNAAVRIFVVSEIERRNLLNAGVADEKIIVNPNGVDVERFRPGLGREKTRAELGVAQDATLVGFIGTFGPWHGVLELSQAITLMPPETRIRFLLVGEGKLRQEAERLINEAGAGDRVIFTGVVEHERVPEFLDACDILVSPHVPLADGKEFFGSPTKLFEYMAMGKGIVASNLGQIGEVLINEETALLVEPGNVDQLRTAILRLAESPALREHLGANAREVAIKRHTWKRNAQNVLDAYKAWVESHQNRERTAVRSV
jgi:glycosyltransferase involved in cell wall biosynthesis